MRLFEGTRPVTRNGIARDAFAGVTLASMNVPQVLAYTRIAGTPVVTGLYTVLLPLIAFAAFGSSRHLVVAADSATAAIFASGLSRMAPAASERYMALVGMVALLTAAMLLVARIFRLGFLADFLSRTVLVGFLAGVGIQVGIAMLGDMSGLVVTAHRTVQRLLELARGVENVHGQTAILSVAVVAVVLGGRRFAPRIPVPMLVVVAAVGGSYAWDFAGRGIATIGEVPGGLPSLTLPEVTFGDVLALLPIAGSCFVMIIAQSAAAARAFAVPYHERVDVDADILGLAVANAAAGVSGAFVVNGSPTQTAMAERAGARSQLAQLVFAGVVALVLVYATGPLQFLPHCVLAAIVFTIAVGLIDIRGLAEIRRESPGEFTLAVVTAAAVALVGVEQGILLAIALSLMRHVRHSYEPHTMVLAPDETGRWVPTEVAPGIQTERGLIVYRFGADVFYANEVKFVDEVRRLVNEAPAPVRHLVVDASAITDIDYSAARSIRELMEGLAKRGVTVVFGRVSPYLRSDMDRHGITTVVGPTRIFSTLHEALEYVHAQEGAGNPAPRS